MSFWGVIANGVGIGVGGLAGIFLGNRISDRMGQTLMAGLSLCIVAIGVGGIAQGGSIILAAVSIALAALVGETVDFDNQIQNFGRYIQKFFSGEQAKLGEHFVASTLVFSMGAMSIVGSLESGMTGVNDTLFSKALIDMILAIVMATTMGWGCVLAALPVLLYQGLLTLGAGFLAPYVGPHILLQMGFIGNILILGVGLNLLELTKIRVGNLILAPFIPLLLIFFPSITL